MRKHFADSIDVGAGGNQECSVCVAEAVKGDFLLDTGIFEPFLERLRVWARLRPLNTMPRPCSPQYDKASSLNGSVACVLVFLGADAHTVATIGRQLDILPTELQNVANTQSGHTGEE